MKAASLMSDSGSRYGSVVYFYCVQLQLGGQTARVMAIPV